PVPGIGGGGGVPFRELLGPTATGVFGPADGNLAPYRNPADRLPPGVPASAYGPVYGDFASRYLMMTRVSNLLTTRCDSFTVYVIVQGWRNAETGDPHLVIQRRAAFLADRSAVASRGGALDATNLP